MQQQLSIADINDSKIKLNNKNIDEVQVSEISAKKIQGEYKKIKNTREESKKYAFDSSEKLAKPLFDFRKK